tara:strand:+ start:167 stop:463 length:297 start_codon:yes stop_codon:yes gene_type:complete
MRNQAYQRKKKNSKAKKIWNITNGAFQKLHRLMGSKGSGQSKLISWNQNKVSINKWVSIPMAIPLPIDFRIGFFFNSESIANKRKTNVSVKKLWENVR